MKFYKATKGTEMFEKYGTELIHEDDVAFTMGNKQRRQIEDAEAEDLAEAFRREEEFDPDIFNALAEMAEIKLPEDDLDFDADDAIAKIEDILKVKLL